MKYDLTGRERAARRGAGAVIFQPPPAWLSKPAWHLIDTGEPGVRPLLWRPGVSRWAERDGTTTTAENAGKLDWIYVGFHGLRYGGDHDGAA